MKAKNGVIFEGKYTILLYKLELILIWIGPWVGLYAWPQPARYFYKFGGHLIRWVQTMIGASNDFSALRTCATFHSTSTLNNLSARVPNIAHRATYLGNCEYMSISTGIEVSGCAFTEGLKVSHGLLSRYNKMASYRN